MIAYGHFSVPTVISVNMYGLTSKLGVEREMKEFFFNYKDYFNHNKAARDMMLEPQVLEMKICKLQ